MSTIHDIAHNQLVREALDAFRREQVSIMELAIAIQQIPSPTGAEQDLAGFVEDHFSEIGLADVGQDGLHNTFARFPGYESTRPLIISAHTDTVFPIGTDLTIKYENWDHPGQGLIYGPGLADNSLGVAGLIVLAKTLQKYSLSTPSDIWFVANVAEEGLGDLRGMRAVVDRFGDQANYVVLEGGSFGHIFNQAIGVRRFELLVETSGGHSWGDYGSPSAIHSLSRLVSAIANIELPKEPKTTLNVGVIEGGTTINTIAARASCQLDLRSTSLKSLEQLVIDVTSLVNSANESDDVKVTMAQIGNRPAGFVPLEADLVCKATDALRQVGSHRVSYMAGSTDANVPISRGIPAICIGLANSANTHRVDELLDPTNLPQGLGQLLLLTLAVAGFDV